MFGVDSEIDHCAGTPFASVCTDLNKLRVGAGAGLELSTSFQKGNDNFNKEWSGGYTTTWSYQTSDELSAAGRDSDTFMVSL